MLPIDTNTQTYALSRALYPLLRPLIQFTPSPTPSAMPYTLTHILSHATWILILQTHTHSMPIYLTPSPTDTHLMPKPLHNHCYTKAAITL